MTDPVTISIAGVGAIAVKEGIKFLYGQAGEILKRWRERKDKSELGDREPTTLVLPPVFDGQLQNPYIHFKVVADLEPTLRALYGDLSVYATGVVPVEKADAELLRKVDTLRRSMESILQQHLTFKGEERPASGTLLSGYVSADSIAGEVIGVEGEGQLQGEARGDVKASKVEPGGRVIGVKWRV